MSKCHEQDLNGCNYMMEVVNSYYPEIEWVHTGGEFDRYDMDWTATTTNGVQVECKVEGKDRRKDKSGKDIDIETYPSAFINSGKFRYMVNNVSYPYLLMGFADGVVLYNLKKLPIEEILVDIDDAAKRFVNNREVGYYNQGKGISNKWCTWNWVYNPAKGCKGWELNVNLPTREKDRKLYKGITVMMRDVN